MLGKFFESLYNKVFVNIVIGRTKTTIYIEECDKKGLLDSDNKIFDITYVDAKMYEFITSYTKKTPYFYISILDHSETQGVIPTCDKKMMLNYRNTESLNVKCFEDKWAYYSSKTELYNITKKYEQFGVDFIFSPFLILRNFFKDKINSSFALFVLIEENILSIAVFDNSTLLYGDSLDLQSTYEHEDVLVEETNDETQNENELDLDGEIDLEDVDAFDEIDGLDDFGNIEDLDSIDDIEEFDELSESDNDIEEIQEQEIDKIENNIENISDAENEVGELNNDYTKFILIQESINRFYKDSRYESKFIEHIYIADSLNTNQDLKRYLEEEMFLTVYIRHLDLSLELCELAKAESK
ncbi:MAG: hypothetical protein GXO30_05405 [Epsilonproteobacteria bacterium]|nr:hypothetical protein [Campylobacterota bacterium]